jgi:hypothetical protein
MRIWQFARKFLRTRAKIKFFYIDMYRYSL